MPSTAVENDNGPRNDNVHSAYRPICLITHPGRVGWYLWSCIGHWQFVTKRHTNYAMRVISQGIRKRRRQLVNITPYDKNNARTLLYYTAICIHAFLWFVYLYRNRATLTDTIGQHNSPGVFRGGGGGGGGGAGVWGGGFGGGVPSKRQKTIKLTRTNAAQRSTAPQ